MEGGRKSRPPERNSYMIELTKLNGEKFYLNPDHIEIIEMKPDTLITLINGRKHYANEPVDIIIDRIIRYKADLEIKLKKIDTDKTAVIDDQTQSQ